jgi:hypothetical protein
LILRAPELGDFPPIAAHNQIGQLAGPAGLMDGTGLGAEILVEREQITPVRIVLDRCLPSHCGTLAVNARPIDIDERVGDQRRDFLERQLAAAGTRRGHGEGAPRDRWNLPIAWMSV